MADAPGTGEVHAAGVVLWRPSGSGPEVALIHRPRYDDWSFPKGKLFPGEHRLLAAVREAAEETGRRTILGRPLSTAHYDSGGRPKRVDYWTGHPVPNVQDSFHPNDEVDAVDWLPVAAAHGRLSYPHDTTILEEFAAGPTDTVPLTLLRHASAGSKESWPGEDLDRPLDADGAAESELLAPLLACYGPARVITSAAERCVATVRPYAAAIGAKLEIEPAFTLGYAGDGPAAVARVPGVAAARGAGAAARGAGAAARGSGAAARGSGAAARGSGAAARGSGAAGPGAAAGGPGAAAGSGAAADRAETADGPEAAAQRMAAIITEGLPTVICAHRENLPPLLAAACAALGADLPGDGQLPKGGFWVLHVAAGRLAAAEQHDLTEA